MATVSEAMRQCDKPLEECYHLYSDARRKLEGYKVQYNKNFNPIYIEFLYDYDGKLNRKEFRRYERTVMAFLVCHPCLSEDYSHILILNVFHGFHKSKLILIPVSCFQIYNIQ